MNTITESASKIAFLMLMGTACLAFLIGVAKGSVTFDAKDFMVLAAAGATFYFAYKGSDNQPFAGK